MHLKLVEKVGVASAQNVIAAYVSRIVSRISRIDNEVDKDGWKWWCLLGFGVVIERGQLAGSSGNSHLCFMEIHPISLHVVWALIISTIPLPRKGE